MTHQDQQQVAKPDCLFPVARSAASIISSLNLPSRRFRVALGVGRARVPAHPASAPRRPST
eukprot:7795237-Heterocapsa_arctica.AAC.1